ncbi:MAG: OmpH family outer membrane protein [Lewinellaceae bacterium]|nr:OmpH family outer membrane protein [Lewinellaceae bacterium]
MRIGVLTFALLLSLVPFSDLSAQRLGYTNSLAILSEMPEVAKADTMIMQLRDSLVAEGESRASALKEKYTQYMQEMQAGTITPKDAKAREAEIQNGQDELQQYEQEITDWLAGKREEFYNPILSRLQQAIDEVGKENNFQFIFDVSSMNIIVYAEESEDVTAQIKEKLGLD